MGLLDQFANLSPEQNQGLLAAAAQILQASGPSRVPVGIGQALGTGLQAYQQTMEANRVRKMDEERRAKEDQFEREYRTAQLGSLKSQQEARQAEAARLAGREQAARESIVNGQLDPKLYAAKLAQFDPEAAIDLMRQNAPKPVTYSTNPVEVMGPKGPMLVQAASDGTHKVMEGFRPYVAPKAARGDGGGGSDGAAGFGKPPPGYRWTPEGTLMAIPGGPGDKLPESQQKQLVGVNNVRSAIKEYREALKNFGSIDALNPDARATMGTKYNNMMLQAKEAYNLGVLNGPDLEILQSVITDPRSVKAAFVSKKALDTQASELDRMMTGMGEVSSKARQPQQNTRTTGNPFQSIPQAAAAHLKMNPKLRDAFDAKYGPGAAASILGK